MWWLNLFNHHEFAVFKNDLMIASHIPFQRFRFNITASVAENEDTND
jgi:hypothetical protein